MGRKNFGKKKKTNHQKKQKKTRKSSKGYPGIPQEQVTCREVAIYVPPDEEPDQESDCNYDDEFCDCIRCQREEHHNGFGYVNFSVHGMLYRLFEAMILSEMFEQRMGNYMGPPFGFSSRRARH